MKKSKLKFKIKNLLKSTFNFLFLTYGLSKSNGFNFESGQSIVELLITIGLSAILLPALLTSMVSARQARPQQDQRLQAIGYLREAQEAVRAVRESSWSTFAVDGTYHPVINMDGTWSLASGQELINGFNFTRQIVISDVSRDSITGNIVTSGGVNDPSTKMVVSTVSWTNPLTSSVTATSYFTRYANLGYQETTFDDFVKGSTPSGSVAITNTNGGEISLGAGNGAGADWCKPGNTVLAKADLPGQGVVQSISATTSSSLDYVYTTTGGNASGDSVDEATINRVTPVPTIISNPPVASNNEAKAYGIYVDKPGGHVYFNENKPPNHTVQIADTNTLVDVGYYDSSGGGTGTSVYALNGIGYTIVGSKLYSFNVSSINGSSSQAELGSVSLAANGNRVIAIKDNSSGNTYAFVAEASSTKQLEIFQINSNGSIVTPAVAYAQIANAQQGKDIYVNNNGTRVYLVTNQYNSGQNQFFILDTSVKSGALPSPVGSFSTYNAGLSAGMNPKGITIVPGNRAIVVGNGGQQYQVYNIVQENNVTYCGGLTLTGGENINAVSSIVRGDQTAYSYILTTDTSHELQVIQGGNGAAFSFGGTYESHTFTATTEAMFNNFIVSSAVPSNASLQFKVAVKHAINNSCLGVTFADSDFVGTDGSSGTYFPATGGQLPAASSNPTGYENPGRCLKYRAYLSTSDITESPEIYDVTFNYSP